MLDDPLDQRDCAVAVARGNPDLLNLVNAVVAGDLRPGTPVHGRSIDAIRSRGHLRVGVTFDPNADSLPERLKKELELAEQVGERIFGRAGCVQFELIRMDERVNSLRSWLHFFEPVLKVCSVVGTILNSNWWHLGMAGKLPELFCPKECAGQQDFV